MLIACAINEQHLQEGAKLLNTKQFHNIILNGLDSKITKDVVFDEDAVQKYSNSVQNCKKKFARQLVGICDALGMLCMGTNGSTCLLSPSSLAFLTHTMASDEDNK